MRKVLIPTDFSDNAMNALKYATELFKYDKSIFIIMHAFKDEVYANKDLRTRETIEEATEIIRNRAQIKLESILKE